MQLSVDAGRLRRVKTTGRQADRRLAGGGGEEAAGRVEPVEIQVRAGLRSGERQLVNEPTDAEVVAARSAADRGRRGSFPKTYRSSCCRMIHLTGELNHASLVDRTVPDVNRARAGRG